MPTPHAYFKGAIVPLSEAKIGVMTHAFNYGTAVFEGIRGNWNEAAGASYLFRLREHMERIGQSSKILGLQMRDTPERLCEIAVELVERSGYTEDIYMRPMVYLSGEVLGVRLHNVESDTLIFLSPFPAYLPET
ncbi:MAG TPA: aminotransferase class IV, partial [Tepidiformaceae bacterium]|nr:aminotransferase class IV [Tepidiformaceae bacterium]